ncbi:hypothetical protein V1505DRAFT_382768 [Lipomyces doorenjongii]
MACFWSLLLSEAVSICAFAMARAAWLALVIPRQCTLDFITAAFHINRQHQLPRAVASIGYPVPGATSIRSWCTTAERDWSVEGNCNLSQVPVVEGLRAQFWIKRSCHDDDARTKRFAEADIAAYPISGAGDTRLWFQVGPGRQT